MKTIISTDKAPAAIGAYSQAVAYGGVVYTSGQLGVDPASGELVSGVEAQTRQAMDNLKAVLAEAGSGFDKALRLTIFLKNIDDFAAVNEVYAGYFATEPPARCCFAVADLPKGALLEIDCIAAV